MATAKIGSAPFTRPVKPEAIRSSANGKSVNGIATHSTEIATSRGKSSRGIRFRAAGTSQSTDAPKMMRSHVMSPGSNASRPIAISRNEDPQMSPIERNIAQSSGVNAPACVPAVVVMTLRRRPAASSPFVGSASGSLTSGG